MSGAAPPPGSDREHHGAWPTAAADGGDLLCGRLVSADLRSRLAAISDSIPCDFGGGSSLLKVLVVADLIIGERLTTCVEIGVYRGRFLLPAAEVLRTLGRGEAIGIDPWSAEAMKQADDHGIAGLQDWTDDQDLDAIADDVAAAVERWSLAGRCRLLRSTSEIAVTSFEDRSVDLLHVDGNHDRHMVERDIELYVPKVRPQGFVILDDTSWASVLPAYVRLRSEHQLVFQAVDFAPAGPSLNDFAVFRIDGSR